MRAWYLQRLEEGTDPLGQELEMVVSRQVNAGNSGLFQEQQMLLTTEPSRTPPFLYREENEGLKRKWEFPVIPLDRAVTRIEQHQSRAL